MKLEYLEIEEFKNLKNFRINFNQDSILDLIIGKNGSGKSNLLEALIEIFGKLEKNELTDFKYKIKYRLHNETIEIINWGEVKFLRENKELKKSEIGRFIPFILYYYAGLDSRLNSFFIKTKTAYKKKGLKNYELNLRKTIDIDHFYYKILLLVMLIYNEGRFNSFLRNFLNVETFEKIDITFKKPDTLKNEKEFITEDGDFWGIKGISKDIISKLGPISTHDEENIGGLSSDKETFQIRLRDNNKIKNFREKIASPRYLFISLESIFQYDMFEDILMEIPKNGHNIFSYSLSEGEKQIITIVGLILLNENVETLILLDEPDAFLHPLWQFNLCKQIIENSGEVIKDSQLIINSHCPSTLISLKDNQINLFEFDDNKIQVSSISRKDAVAILSEGYISLSEDESKLKIDNVVKNSKNPVLFTEGITDELILETAWNKLYPGIDKKFLIHHAFCCSFLRNMLNEKKLFEKYPNKHFFALFDFDEAYNDWNQLGDLVETDVFIGLCKKMKSYNCYSLLLPVPKNEKIRSQVIKRKNDDGSYETFKGNSLLTIELLFYGLEETKNYFLEETIQGGGKIIMFNGDKVKFAEEVVPTLKKDAFEIFESLFNLINSKIP